MEKELVRTRFAPSPTGRLHIGGLRTVIINYLAAKKKKGKFILRIEDTDIKRNQEKFINSLYKDLLWLGLKPDESIFQEGKRGPYRQTQRLEIYRKYIDKLIQEKKAYHCFCSLEELSREKKEYIETNKKRNYQYSRKCLNLNYQQICRLLEQATPYVIRFKINQEKDYKIEDLVRKEVIFKGKDIEDFILFRQNGIPNYNFACVIDDYLMEINHVLRGEEHLSNTAKQLAIYEALGWKNPLFGHLSIIFSEKGKKFSKRTENTNEYQTIYHLKKKGYLPSAIINYLLLLGWHPRKQQEFFSLEEAIENFDLSSLNSSSPIFSLEKLNWFNNNYIQKLDEKDFEKISYNFLAKHYSLQKEQKDYAKEISLLFRSQINNFQELVALSSYFFQTLHSSSLNFQEREKLKEKLGKISDWKEEEIKNILNKFVSKDEKSHFFSLLRISLTGTKKGPELAKIIKILGKKRMEKFLILNV